MPRRRKRKRIECRVAELDVAGRLIGYSRRVPSETDVDVPDNCDLPTNGQYQWIEEREAFYPVWVIDGSTGRKVDISTGNFID